MIDPGVIESKVRSDIASAVCSAPMGEALAELAYSLARSLDGGRCPHCGLPIGAAPEPNVARELRAVLSELAAASVSADDDDLAKLLSGVSGQPSTLPTKIRDIPQS